MLEKLGRMNRQTAVKLAAVIITVVLVTILLSQIKISDVITTLRSINPLYLIVGFTLYVSSYFFRAVRFYILLNREVRLRDLFSIVCVHNMANNILPARTGELSYIYLIKKLHNKKTGEGIATLLLSRIFDFISISILFIISALVIHDLPEIIMKTIYIIAIFFISGVIFLVILLHYSDSILDIIGSIFKILDLYNYRIIDYLLKKGEETVECFDNIRNDKKYLLLVITAISLVIWLSLYSLNYVFVTAIDVDLSFFTVLLASTFMIFTIVLPIQGIGGFGTYEGGWAVGFIVIGLTKEVAIGSGFGFHIVIWIYFLILGLAGLISIKKQ